MLSKIRPAAALTLVWALLMPSLMLLLVGAARYGRMRVHEQDYGRALQAASEALLLSYDRELWRDYHLWAGQGAVVNLAPFAAYVQVPEALRPQLRVAAVTAAENRTALLAQIRRQMAPRAPIFLAQTLYRSFKSQNVSRALALRPQVERSLHAAGSYFPAEELNALQPYLDGTVPPGDGAGRDLPALPPGEGPFPALPPGETPLPIAPPADGSVPALPPGSPSPPEQPPPEGPPAGEGAPTVPPEAEGGVRGLDFSKAGDALIRHFEDEIQTVLDELQLHFDVPVLQAEQPQDLAPSTLLRLIDGVDQLWSRISFDELDRLYVCEYLMAFARSPVIHEEDAEGQLRKLKHPDGRAMSTLAHPLPLEKIIFRSEQGERYAAAYIWAVRWAFQFAARLQDSGTMLRMRFYARFLSGAIWLLSLGTVYIPSRALAYLLVLIEAVFEGRSDSQRLQQGYRVPLWPFAASPLHNIRLSYRDYLRFIALLERPEATVEALQQALQKQYPAAVDFQYRLTASWAGREQQRVIAYDHQEP